VHFSQGRENLNANVNVTALCQNQQSVCVYQEN